MDILIVKTYDSSLQNYELSWLEEILKDYNKKILYKNPTASLYTSMVYGFANHLPYSMDIEQPEYVPADFLNMSPYDVEENSWFKWKDRRTFFNSMINWGDTFKTGMLLQICNIFQKMILGQFPSDFELKEENYGSWGIDSMTKDKEYNRCFFETLKSLPAYYQKVVHAVNNNERRNVLDQIYEDIMRKIAARFDSFKETDVDGNIVRESKGNIPISPSSDIEMLVHWDNIRFHDGITHITEAIKKEQLTKYNSNKPQSINEIPTAGYIQRK